MKVFVGVPTHDRPTAHFTVSIIRFMLEGSNKYEIQYEAPRNVSNLAEQRCVLLQRAIESGADKLLFIDDDIMFKPTQAFKLLETEGDVVGALYRKKKDEVEHVGYTLGAVGRANTTKPTEDSTLVGMACLGMGFTVIDLSFIRKMVEAEKNRSQKEFRFFKRKDCEDVIPALFEFKAVLDLDGETRFLGEDETFCRHVIYAGGSVWLHPDIVVGHVGAHVYK